MYYDYCANKFTVTYLPMLASRLSSRLNKQTEEHPIPLNPFGPEMKPVQSVRDLHQGSSAACCPGQHAVLEPAAMSCPPRPGLP